VSVLHIAKVNGVWDVGKNRELYIERLPRHWCGFAGKVV
jgi:hypothetical protein